MLSVIFPPLFLIITIFSYCFRWQRLSSITHIVYANLTLFPTLNRWSFTTSGTQVSKNTRLASFTPVSSIILRIIYTHNIKIQQYVLYVKDYFRKEDFRNSSVA
jgi:hypothetical protein